MCEPSWSPSLSLGHSLLLALTPHALMLCSTCTSAECSAPPTHWWENLWPSCSRKGGAVLQGTQESGSHLQGRGYRRNQRWSRAGVQTAPRFCAQGREPAMVSGLGSPWPKPACGEAGSRAPAASRLSAWPPQPRLAQDWGCEQRRGAMTQFPSPPLTCAQERQRQPPRSPAAEASG